MKKPQVFRAELTDALKAKPERMELYSRLTALVTMAEVRNRAKYRALTSQDKTRWRAYYDADDDVAQAVLEVLKFVEGTKGTNNVD